MPVYSSDILRLENISDLRLSPGGNLLAYVVSDLDPVDHAARFSLWFLRDGAEIPEQISSDAHRIDCLRFAPDGDRLAFVAGAQRTLHIMPLVSQGIAEPVPASPLGVSAFDWSPDGQRIACNARALGQEPHPSEGRAREAVGPAEPADHAPQVVRRAYHRAEIRRTRSTGSHALFLVALDGSPARKLAEDVADSQAPAWRPDGEQIAFVRLRSGPFDCAESDLWVVSPDAPRHEEEQLSEEIPCATAPAWSPDGRFIACFGAEPASLGPNGPIVRVWLLDTKEPRAARVIAPDFDCAAMLPRIGGCLPAPVWNSSGEGVRFSAADRGRIHFFHLDIATGEATRIIDGARQVFQAHAPPASDRIACVLSDSSTPGDLHLLDGKGQQELSRIQLNEELATELGQLSIEARSFVGPDGTSLDGWLYRPAGVAGPLPLAVSVHGGPHGFVGDAFSATHFYRYVLASRGWAVLALNASGSTSYGEAFAKRIIGRWGELDLPEHLAAVDALIAEGLVDAERLAIVGYSYGGFLAAWAIGQTDRFRAAAVGAPIANLHSFYGTSDIGPWFCSWGMGGGPDEVPDRYRQLSPIEHLRDADTPVLLLHGEDDVRCPIGQSEELFARLQNHGRSPVEFIRYPGANHGFPGGGRPSHRVDYVDRIVEWLERHVGAAD